MHSLLHVPSKIPSTSRVILHELKISTVWVELLKLVGLPLRSLYSTKFPDIARSGNLEIRLSYFESSYWIDDFFTATFNSQCPQRQ